MKEAKFEMLGESAIEKRILICSDGHVLPPYYTYVPAILLTLTNSEWLKYTTQWTWSHNDLIAYA